MLHAIPGYSQHLDVKDAWWQPRACGIVSLKMVIDYFKKTGLNDEPTIAQLIEEGVAREGHIPEVGWRHKTLAELATIHKLFGKNFDWNEISENEAWTLALPFLEKGPLIASIRKELDPNERRGHLVVLCDYQSDTIYYHDPDTHDREKILRTAPKDAFLHGWKKRVIAVQPDRFF